MDNVYGAKNPRNKKMVGSLPPIKDQENTDKMNSPSLGKIPDSTKSKKNKKQKLTNYPNIADLPTWKKKHKLDPEAKVYCINGGYPDINL